MITMALGNVRNAGCFTSDVSRRKGKGVNLGLGIYLNMRGYAMDVASGVQY